MRRLSFIIVLLALIGVAASGCGDDSSTSSSSSDGGSADYIKQVKERVEQGLGQGSFKAPPTSAPAHEQGKTLALIGTEALNSGKEWADGAKEAATALGWKTKFYDTKGDPTTALPAIRSAISRNVDGIATWNVDCQYVAAGLRAAKKANIPTVTAESADCDATDPSAEPLYTAELQFAAGKRDAFLKEAYEMMALYPMAKTGEDTHLLYAVDNTFQPSKDSVDIIRKVYEPCTSCSYVAETFPVEEIGTKLQARTEQALLKNPKVNSVLSGYAEIYLGGVQAAVRSSNRNVLMGAGDTSNAAIRKLVKEGKVGWIFGYAGGWEGYGTMDTMLRVFAGEDPVSSGIGINLVDKDHNLDENAEYKPPFDYQALYKKAWGVE